MRKTDKAAAIPVVVERRSRRSAADAFRLGRKTKTIGRYGQVDAPRILRSAFVSSERLDRAHSRVDTKAAHFAKVGRG